MERSHMAIQSWLELQNSFASTRACFDVNEERTSWLEVQFKRLIVVPMALEVQSTQKDALQPNTATFMVTFQSKIFIKGSARRL